jgi:membrane protein DedA with SNARE-associated domain
MDVVQPVLDFLATHLLSVVFVVSMIEAAGVPCPGRIVLVLAATVPAGATGLTFVALAAAIGFVLGDHVPYVVGLLTGPRLLTLYCRITLGSERCVEKTIAYFVRFGAAALLLSRFSTGVRLFASVLSGCGHITYGRFVFFDAIGTVVYVTLWVAVGRLVGAQALELLRRYGAMRALVLVVPAAFLALLGYRLWRRSRFGPARIERPTLDAVTAATCEVLDVERRAS